MKGVTLSVESMGIIIAVREERVKRVWLTESGVEGSIRDKAGIMSRPKTISSN